MLFNPKRPSFPQVSILLQLPKNYNFEVPKTVWKLREAGARCVALQLPEGLQIFATTIADILERFAAVDVVILGDVTYGACCIDDLGAEAVGADFLVHYGHSCLVPLEVTKRQLRALYVFVEILFDGSHLVETIRSNFPKGSKLAVLGTIQFGAGVHAAAEALREWCPDAFIPQAHPLSRGEVLGCTSPRLPSDTHSLVFVADGRFHLESAMIHNPNVPAYRYDPYQKRLTRESYDTGRMIATRTKAVQIAGAPDAKTYGLVLGTLGRQGNPAVLQRLQALLGRHGRRHFVLLLSELFPARLSLMAGSVDAWVQVACPRLSIDWGHAFDRPLLTPFEAYAAMGETVLPAALPTAAPRELSLLPEGKEEEGGGEG